MTHQKGFFQMTEKPLSHGKKSISVSTKPRELMTKNPRLTDIWTADVITLFPESFPGVLGASIIGSALAKKLWVLQTVNLRDFGIGPHKKVDDTPAGGGSGLVLRADVIEPALEKSISNFPKGRPLIYMSPRGKPFEQKHAKKWASGPGLVILCGRFEGIDERILESYDIEEISLGDFVMTGGEIAAQAIIDTTVRLLPGVLGNPESIVDESHTSGLLEYPHYTKPSEWKNKKIPETLLSGHHENIAKWRLNQAKATTKKNRPDLWKAWNISKNKSNLKD